VGREVTFHPGTPKCQAGAFKLHRGEDLFDYGYGVPLIEKLLLHLRVALESQSKGRMPSTINHQEDRELNP
jgi:hypothetical protein